MEEDLSITRDIFSVCLCLLHCFPAVSSRTVFLFLRFLLREGDKDRKSHLLVNRHRVLPRFSINLLAFYHDYRSLIGYATHHLFCDR